jgi:hypothetical protein
MESGYDHSPLRFIHIDVKSGLTVLVGEDGRAISCNPNLLLQKLLSPASPELTPAEPVEEKESTVTLSGRLKSVPKEGRVDGSGFPTAWARFAAHQEGSNQAHMYLATFHRKSREIALGLKPDAHIIVECYPPHPANEPGKSDTLSVIHIINYPGKPPK